MSKVAIASNDQININEHFGQASGFYIYEENSSKNYAFVEYRKANPIDIGNTEHARIEANIVLLEDVKIVLVNQIGPNATNALQSKGILSFALSGTIEKALSTLTKKSALVDKFTSGQIKSCSSCSGASGGCHC